MCSIAPKEPNKSRGMLRSTQHHATEPHSFLRSFLRPFVRSSVRSFFRSSFLEIDLQIGS